MPLSAAQRAPRGTTVACLLDHRPTTASPRPHLPSRRAARCLRCSAGTQCRHRARPADPPHRRRRCRRPRRRPRRCCLWAGCR
eukprot:355366-Chlamydomonas_euryale.AAC.5